LTTCAAAAAVLQNASTLLGPAADLLSRKNPLWLAQQGFGLLQQQRQQQQQQRGLSHVAAVFLTDAGGSFGKAAATAAHLAEGRFAAKFGLSRGLRGFGFWQRLPPEGLAPNPNPGFTLDRGAIVTIDMVLGSIAKQQQVNESQEGLPMQQQQQWIQDLENLVAWWPQLLAAQEELQQAAWQLLVQKILMRPDQVRACRHL
jgi:hypothetical protein